MFVIKACKRRSYLIRSLSNRQLLLIDLQYGYIQTNSLDLFVWQVQIEFKKSGRQKQQKIFFLVRNWNVIRSKFLQMCLSLDAHIGFQRIFCATSLMLPTFESRVISVRSNFRSIIGPGRYSACFQLSDFSVRFRENKLIKKCNIDVTSSHTTISDRKR